MIREPPKSTLSSSSAASDVYKRQIYYYIICNFVINTPIAVWPLFLYCFILAVPGDIALSILAAVLAKRIKPVLGLEAMVSHKRLKYSR